MHGDDEDGIMPCPFCEEDLYDDRECELTAVRIAVRL